MFRMLRSELKACQPLRMMFNVTFRTQSRSYCGEASNILHTVGKVGDNAIVTDHFNQTMNIGFKTRA